MKERSKDAARYLRQVRRLLPCGRKTKNAITRQIVDSVDDYLSGHPDADASQLKAQFGEPEVIAAAYVESAGTAEILKSLQIRRRIVSVITVAALAALLAWGGVVTWAAIKANRSINGTLEVSTFEIIDYVPSNETDSIIYVP